MKKALTTGGLLNGSLLTRKKAVTHHDDAPDSMTILAEFFESIAGNIKGDRDVSGIFS